MKKLALLFSVFLMLLPFSLSAAAASQPYEKGAFDDALSSGGPVIIQFHADWCNTCKAQQPLIDQVLAEPRMKDVKLFIANFDTEKALRKAFNVSTQSTFIVFKGGREVGRFSGQTSLPAIENTFARSLQ